jgi:hypothetical protein
MASFWILATLIASAAQTARNAMQSTLTASIGTIGAAQVRFLYGFPFSLLFLLGTVMVTGEVPFWVPLMEASNAGGKAVQRAINNSAFPAFCGSSRALFGAGLNKN